MNPTRTNRGTILIVHDDPAVLVLMQTILKAADYRVLLAAERADAVRMARQKHIHIDIVLLDVRVPGVWGTGLADEILSNRPGIRVLWMSGFVHEEFIRVKMVYGDAGFLTEPLRCNGFLPAVQGAMERRPQGWGMSEYDGDEALTA